ncbi:hypothetical protein RhiLY_02773 [Ceratobasidium sp. AG-Ba]|nr:hypothetical protein RhiLY_02773 [Ceratobasidium sp. AG-Ba]
MSYAAVPNLNFDGTPHPMDEHKAYGSHSSKEDIELSHFGSVATHTTAQPYYEPHKSSAVHLSRVHEARSSTTHGPIACAYLAFCYSAATRIIPVHVWKIDQPIKHLYGIKAGVTTISIVIIALALLPVKSLLDDLKCEEFFRRLRKMKEGVPLDTLNDVSTPSHSLTKGFFSILRFEASKYFAGALFSSFIAAGISSLAPAALSVGVIAVDGEITAFRVGAVARDSIYISGLESAYENFAFNSKASQAASMGWVQTTLGIDMTFKPNMLKYAVPVPLDLTPKSLGRWELSDPPMALPLNYNPNNTFSAHVNVTLPSHGVGASIHLSNFQSSYSKTTKVFSSDFDSTGSGLFNLTTRDPPISGVTAWLLTQCTNCGDPTLSGGDPGVIDFTGIPFQKFSSTKMVGENVTAVEQNVGILVIEDGRTIGRQGNLQISQTRLLLTKALQAYTANSGPSTEFYGLGRIAQIQLIYGPQGNASETTTLKPLPVEQIAQGYNLALQAAMRSYLAGSMGSAYVPGRTQTPTLVFTSSLPHVIVSTILFVLIALFVNVCHFRSENEQFTLFSVAAALAHSNLPAICEDIRYADHGKGAVREDVALETLRGRRVKLVNSGGPGHSLNLE